MLPWRCGEFGLSLHLGAECFAICEFVCKALGVFRSHLRAEFTNALQANTGRYLDTNSEASLDFDCMSGSAVESLGDCDCL